MFGPSREVIIVLPERVTSWSYFRLFPGMQAAARALSDFVGMVNLDRDGNTYYPAPRSELHTSSSVQFTEKQRRRTWSTLAYLGKD